MVHYAKALQHKDNDKEDKTKHHKEDYKEDSIWHEEEIKEHLKKMKPYLIRLTCL